tara:strand:- start:1715 stop:1942 length:228 start_codon:yes stop_codon:yes gene_type:complete
MIPDFMVLTPIFETFYNKIKQLSKTKCACVPERKPADAGFLLTCGLAPERKNLRTQVFSGTRNKKARAEARAWSR